MEDLSRRTFLRGALLAGAGAVGAGALTACAPQTTESKSAGASAAADDATVNGDYPWPVNPPEIAAEDVEEEVSADIIIVGLGIAGVAAARSAVEEGASIIAFEKSEKPNVRSGDFAIMGGETMKRWGRENIVDIDEACDHEVEEGSYFPKRSIYTKWAKHSGEAFDWYLEAVPDIYYAESSIAEIPDGVEQYITPYFVPLPDGYDFTKEAFPCYPSSVSCYPDQKFIFEANWDMVVGTGLMDARFGHFAEKLEKDGDRVSTVYARNAETGKYVKATASKGVILATGEYSSNPEFLKFFCPATVENEIQVWWPDMDVEGKPVNQGDGLKLGNWVGAAVQQHHAPMIHWMGGTYGGTGMDMSPVGTAPFLYLNKDGKRFTNEDIPGQQMQNQIENQPGRMLFQFFDGNWAEQWASFPIKHGKATYQMESPTGRVEATASPSDYISQTNIDLAVEAGVLLKADTLDELLTLCKEKGLDIENAKASIERYNELAKAGKDEDFDKIASRLFPVETAPFYATPCRQGDMLVCIGGLVSDEECHVFDEEKRVIPGFYVAGNVQGNRFAVQYPIAFKGVSHSMALYYGYVAGKNAVAGA